MNIGIDKIGFYVPAQYIDMKDLALSREVDPNKFIIGLGQDQMAIPFPSQDTLTLGANAAHLILNENDKKDIDLVLFATESGLDYSKALALPLVKLLNLPHRVRALEIKEACYAGTAALQLAKAHIALHPDKKVLIVTSDISRYGINTPGEPTQGAGAIAMILSHNPSILKLDAYSAYHADDIQDFWRPNYSDIAFVDGKYSNEQYQHFFETTFNQYLKDTQRNLNDFSSLLFHIPYTKIGLKALRSIATKEDHPKLHENYQHAITYNRRIGNIYTGSLYLSLISLLDSNALKPNQRIGLFSYGSGSMGEFFSGTLVENYKEHLITSHQETLDNRVKISIEDYEKDFLHQLPTDGSYYSVDHTNDPGPYVLDHMENHTRYYIKKTVK